MFLSRLTSHNALNGFFIANTVMFIAVLLVFELSPLSVRRRVRPWVIGVSVVLGIITLIGAVVSQH